jgi:hypothetical protein
MKGFNKRVEVGIGGESKKPLRLYTVITILGGGKIG